MLLRNVHWNSIRDRFSDNEKEIINSAIMGAAICPKGVILDEDILGPELLAKLKSALCIKS